MEDIIVYVLTCIVQMLVFYVYIREMLGIKRNIRWFVASWCMVSIVDEFMIRITNYNSTIRNAVLYLLCLEIVAFIICQGSWMKKLFATLAFVVFIISVETVMVNVVALFIGKDINEVIESKSMNIVLPILTQMLASVILFFVVYIWKRQKNYNVSLSQWMGVLAVSLGCFVSICILTFETVTENEITKGYIAVCVILVFINFISYYFYIILAQKNEMEVQSKLQLKQISMYEQWNEEMKNVRKEMISFKHDMNNHFEVLREICDDKKENSEKRIKKIRDYLESLGLEYKSIISNVETGNMALDALIGMKKSYASSKGITLNTEIYIPIDMNCDNMDMVIILGNLLDNAIEACEKVCNEKSINLIMQYKLNTLIISIENTYNGDLKKTEKDNKLLYLPRTTKKDIMHHGIGMQNVKNIVEKYDGDIYWETQGNIFRVEILIYKLEKCI